MSGFMYGGGVSGAGSGVSGDKPQLDYDAAAERSFISFFNGLPKADKGTVRLFNRSDFYSVHGQDAILVAQTVYKTMSVIKYLGGGAGSSNGPSSSKLGAKDTGLPSCTLNQAAAKTFLRDALTVKQMRVEIYTNEGGKRNNQWAISQQVGYLSVFSMQAMCLPLDWTCHRHLPVICKKWRTCSLQAQISSSRQ
jgi:DNA mismatch repair protein MSH2